MIMARVFVSNLTNSMMTSRDKRAQQHIQDPWQRGGSACNWRIGESRTSSLEKINSSI